MPIKLLSASLNALLVTRVKQRRESRHHVLSLRCHVFIHLFIRAAVDWLQMTTQPDFLVILFDLAAKSRSAGFVPAEEQRKKETFPTPLKVMPMNYF